jgi:ribosomal protein L29
MKAEIEAKISALEAELIAERVKLDSMITNIPAEFHNMSRELFNRIAAFFA